MNCLNIIIGSVDQIENYENSFLSNLNGQTWPMY